MGDACAEPDETLMMRPPSRIRGSACRVTKNRARSLIAMSRSKSSMSMDSMGPRRLMPVVWTRTSTGFETEVVECGVELFP